LAVYGAKLTAAHGPQFLQCKMFDKYHCSCFWNKGCTNFYVLLEISIFIVYAEVKEFLTVQSQFPCIEKCESWQGLALYVL